ncbi:hypothetical protein QUF54_00710 [Candidatus Marithioploca araucensis]|uniref:Uncharacterized protein n=1 Tax=Candidatus Marithioploca araucensis TaxID=70273 RepID=A0ABT7VQC4_9GAMM|nr:hypothetical protein [Candidatus Marithioploca araucensis]
MVGVECETILFSAPGDHAAYRFMTDIAQGAKASGFAVEFEWIGKNGGLFPIFFKFFSKSAFFEDVVV